MMEKERKGGEWCKSLDPEAVRWRGRMMWKAKPKWKESEKAKW